MKPPREADLIGLAATVDQVANSLESIVLGQAAFCLAAADVWREALREKWQPTTSAPRDGREIILAVANRAGAPGKILVGHYQPGGHCIEDHPPIDAGWYFWNGCMFDVASKPTHWMSLPESPT